MKSFCTNTTNQPTRAPTPESNEFGDKGDLEMNDTKTTTIARRPWEGRSLITGLLTATAISALLLASTMVYAGVNPGSRGDQVKFEPIQGTKLKRVILTPKAIQRLGIKHAKISTKKIPRKQMVGGSVAHPLKNQSERLANKLSGITSFVAAAAGPKTASINTAPQAAGAWIKVMLSEEEWDRVDQSAPARILPLATRPDLPKEVFATASKIPPTRDVIRTMLLAYYKVNGDDNGLKINDRMRVELTLKGNDQTHTVMPYSALYYDGKGVPWVYIESKPGTYERRRVEIERIVGDDVLLKSGPPVGTSVATVGATFLFGAEVIFKK